MSHVVEMLMASLAGTCAPAGRLLLGRQLDLYRVLSGLRHLAVRKAADDRTGHPLPVPVLIRRGEKGQALIEFAFVFPLLFVFIMVIVDFGIALDRREMIQHAVRDGARSGAVGSSEATMREAAIKDHTYRQSQGILDSSDVTVCYDDENLNGDPGDAGDSVRVSGSYTYNFMIGGGPFLSNLIPAIEMTPTAEARLEKAVPGANRC